MKWLLSRSLQKKGKTADALSTSMFVKGLSGAEEYWRAHQDFDMILITEDGQVYVTEGIENSFTLNSSFANMELHVMEAAADK